MAIKKLIVPLDRPIAVFYIDTEESGQDLVERLQHYGFDYFIERYPGKLIDSEGLPNLEEAYVLKSVKDA